MTRRAKLIASGVSAIALGLAVLTVVDLLSAEPNAVLALVLAIALASAVTAWRGRPLGRAGTFDWYVVAGCADTVLGSHISPVARGWPLR